MEKAKLKFTIENLGKIKHAEIELNKMTTIIGQNSTSKTYLNYMIYGFLHYLLQINLYPFFLGLEKGERTTNYKKFKTLGIQEPEILNTIEDEITSYIQSDTLIFQIDFSLFARKISIFLNSIAMFYSKIISTHEIGFSLTCMPSLSVELDNHASFESLPLGGVYKKNIKFTKPKNSLLVDFNFSNSYSNFTQATISDVVAELVTGIIRNYFMKILPNPYIICSERSAIPVFYNNIKDLANTTQRSKFDNNSVQYVANKVLRHDDDLDNKSIQAFEGLYQQAMLDNITFFDGSLKKINISSIFNDKQYKEIYSFIQKMGDGKYKVKKITDNENKLLYEVKNVGELEINAASSSIKSLYMLDAYIKKFAQKGDLLIIDEPELNLHPSNQRKIARLLAMLANNGIQIMFTTHSDYIMNEFNNLTELSSLSENSIVEICSNHKLSRAAVLSHEDINPYVTRKAKSTVELKKCKKKNFRFIYEDFDKEIIDFAKFAKEIRGYSNEANV